VSKFRQFKRLAVVACAVFAIMLAVTAPSEAASGGHGGGFSGGHAGGFSGGHVGGRPGFVGHHGFEAHRFDGHRFDGHHFDGRFHHGFVVGPVFPYYGYGYAPYYPPAYGYDTPSYYWYCPSYGAYYPSVDSCPDNWQPVPAS
jgi:hypothetical protein